MSCECIRSKTLLNSWSVGEDGPWFRKRNPIEEDPVIIPRQLSLYHCSLSFHLHGLTPWYICKECHSVILIIRNPLLFKLLLYIVWWQSYCFRPNPRIYFKRLDISFSKPKKGKVWNQGFWFIVSKSLQISLQILIPCKKRNILK